MSLIDKEVMLDLLPLAIEERTDELLQWMRANLVDDESFCQFLSTTARWTAVLMNVIRGEEPGGPPVDEVWVIESTGGSIGNEPHHAVARLIAAALNDDTDHIIGISRAVISEDERYMAAVGARMIASIRDLYRSMPKPTDSTNGASS